jgi:oligosaccharide reducing-end xylanase
MDLHKIKSSSFVGRATLAANPEIGKPFVQDLWCAQIPSGKSRYYDGMLYMPAMLHASGNFKIYIQG